MKFGWLRPTPRINPSGRPRLRQQPLRCKRPADAIGGFAPPLVGETAVVALRSRRPFVNRSRWHWFICSSDGSDCKVLPRRQNRPTWQYFMEPAMQGKCLSVQVDYDQEGASYSAMAVLGVVGSAEAPTTPLYGPQCGSRLPAPSRPQTIATHLHLYDLQSLQVWLRWDHARGGALAPLGNDSRWCPPPGKWPISRGTCR